MRALLVIILSIALAVCIAAPARSAGLSPEQIMSFADHLFAQEDYYRAITEYERLIFFHPGHRLAAAAQFQIALSYYQGKRYDEAGRRFRELSRELTGTEYGRRSLLMLAETYTRWRDHSAAIVALTSYLEIYPESHEADEARLRLGLAYLRQGKWQRADQEFLKVPAGSALRADAEDLSEAAKVYPDLPRKSPAMAGALSAVLPGAGQLYVGRPRDATVSFLLNGLFIWATVEAFRNDNDVTGGILLFFESGWYFGNIYNASSSAHKYNQRAEDRFFDSTQERMGLSYFRDYEEQSFLALTFRF